MTDDDSGVTDPDRVQERLDALNLTRRQFAPMVPVSTNTLQRVIEGSGAASSRRRIVAKLAELEAGDAGPVGKDVETLVGDGVVLSISKEYGEDGSYRIVVSAKPRG